MTIKIGHYPKMAPAEKYQMSLELKKTLESYNIVYGKQGFFTGFDAIFETDNHILLNYSVKGYPFPGYYIANKKRMTGKYFTHDVPKVIREFPLFMIAGTDGKSLISVLDAGFILSFKDDFQAGNNTYLKNLKTVLDNLQDEDNPIIIFYQLQDNY
jgi:hypothetical protein